MQAQFSQASQFHQAGQLDKAEPIYRELLVASPNHPVLLARLAILLQQKGKPFDAIELMEKAIEQAPEEYELVKQGIVIATQASRNDLAERWLQIAIQKEPNEVALKEQLVGVLIGNHKESEALKLIKDVLKVTPQSANAHNLKGLAMSRLGDTEKGYKAFQKAVSLNPGQLGAVRNLLIYGKGKKEPLLDQIIPQLERQLAVPNMPPQAKMNMAFVVSQYFEKQKNAKKMFQYLKQGNDICRSSFNYSHDQTVRRFESIKTLFNEALLEALKGQGIDDGSAIFILGMPRSGTTLIEQILSSHSQVESEGEILDLEKAFAEHAEVLFGETSSEQKAASCKVIAQTYVDSVRKRNHAAHFTDKMPYNFIFVGLIASAMPNAKIIHCTRDPIETCFSIYKQNFSGNHPYTNELTELGQYFKSYKDLMSYWEVLFEGQIYEANYERMVDQSETEIPRLIEFCGLEMEDACMGFHKNKRAVRTASVAQVRQPIYKDAKKASSPYAEMLTPLVEAIDS